MNEKSIIETRRRKIKIRREIKEMRTEKYKGNKTNFQVKKRRRNVRNVKTT